MNTDRYKKTKIATALYIDDQEETALIDQTNLKQYGIEITVLTDSAKAVEKYNQVDPDIIIIDLEFPGQEKNGIDIFIDLFKNDKNIMANKIVVPNSIHMNEQDDLGVKFWNKVIELTKREPVAIINRLKENKANDLVWVLGHLIEDRVGESEINRELKDYIDKRDEEF